MIHEIDVMHWLLNEDYKTVRFTSRISQHGDHCVIAAGCNRLTSGINIGFEVFGRYGMSTLHCLRH